MTLHAGAASVEITPDGAVPMSGYGARESPSTGVHDPLEAAALVLSDGGTTVAIVSVDLLNVSRPLTAGVEHRLERAGVRVDEVVLAATHTHGGPYVPTPAIDVHPTLGVDEDVSAIIEEIERNIARTIEAAIDTLEPARVHVGTARDDGTIVNRREKMGARIPVDTVDPAVTALRIEGESGRETILYSLACHPVSIRGSDTLLTADWPGVVRRSLTEGNTDRTVLFCNGAAGELTTRSLSSSSKRGDDPYSYMETVGEELATTVREALDSATNASGFERGPLVAESRTIRLPIRSTPPADVLERRRAELESIRDDLLADGHETAAARYQGDLHYIRELRSIAEWDASQLPARLQYVEVGPVGLLTFPGEALLQHGLDFKAAATVDTLLPVGYATDYVGYLPTLAELENWGYEVRTAKVAPEGVVRFRRAAMDLLSDGDGSRSV